MSLSQPGMPDVHAAQHEVLGTWEQIRAKAQMFSGLDRVMFAIMARVERYSMAYFGLCRQLVLFNLLLLPGV